MFIILIRVIFIYFAVLVFLRLMGKRQIGEMQPYEVVITLIIADLATLPMSDTNIPLVNGILPLAILVMLHYGITFLTRKFVAFRHFMSGAPVIVISPKGIEYDTLKSLNMNLDDLQEMLRGCNFYSFDQVAYAIIETNGKMSVIPTSENAPVTAQDLSIKNPPPQLPSVVISDGKLVKNKIEEQNLDTQKIMEILKKLNIQKLKEIIVMSIDADDKMYYQKKGENFIVIENYKNKLKIK